MRQVYLNKYGQNLLTEMLKERKIPTLGINVKKPRISHENGMPYINLYSNNEEVEFDKGKTIKVFNSQTMETEDMPEFELVAHSIHIPLDIKNNPLHSERWKKIKSCVLKKK